MTHEYLHSTLFKVVGLEVNFLVHLQRFASKMFSISKLVTSLANSFQMFGRQG